jgi:glycosyltransferase involved in cell wall biosynthesis
MGGWEKEPDALVPFLQELRKPVVTTLHTVLPHPTPHIRSLIGEIASHSTLVTTMVHLGAHILEEDYGLPADRIVVIPHGIPDSQPVPTEVAKRRLGLQGWRVLSTFGLINRGKGLEYALRAIPDIVKDHPDVQYLVLGETHPVVRLREGESYRNSLVALVHKLGVENHVHFVNRYLNKNELLAYLQATDIYLTPYLNRDQIASGTLAFAVGLGKACVSTPYLYAQEMLGEGRGMLAQFKSSRSLARCVRLYLEHPSLRAHAEQSTREFGQRTTWPRVAEQFIKVFETAQQRAADIPAAV